MQPDALDNSVLRELASWGPRPTYAIRNGVNPKLATRQILKSCRRLEQKGYAEIDPTQHYYLSSWRITPAGRTALSDGRG